MNRLRLSIAMTTYNGARFVQQQLESFAAQSRQPDELVVCDDQSTDETAQIVRRFAAGAGFPVRFVVNESNLGVGGNFERGIELATGDIIFLSDQDDVWHAAKLARFEEVFARHSAVGLVFADADVVDQELRPLGYTFWRRLGFSARQQASFEKGKGFEIFLRHCFVAGATLAFRASFKPLILPLSRKWLYDAWIAMVISAVAETRLVGEAMNQYRQHPTQVMGGAEKRGLWRTYVQARRAVDESFFLARAVESGELRERLLAAGGMSAQDRIVRMIEEKAALCRTRARMRRQPMLRIPLVLRELLAGRYHRYAHGLRTAALDLFV